MQVCLFCFVFVLFCFILFYFVFSNDAKYNDYVLGCMKQLGANITATKAATANLLNILDCYGPLLHRITDYETQFHSTVTEPLQKLIVRSSANASVCALSMLASMNDEFNLPSDYKDTNLLSMKLQKLMTSSLLQKEPARRELAIKTIPLFFKRITNGDDFFNEYITMFEGKGMYVYIYVCVCICVYVYMCMCVN